MPLSALVHPAINLHAKISPFYLVTVGEQTVYVDFRVDVMPVGLQRFGCSRCRWEDAVNLIIEIGQKKIAMQSIKPVRIAR